MVFSELLFYIQRPLWGLYFLRIAFFDPPSKLLNFVLQDGIAEVKEVDRDQGEVEKVKP
jgi:hypothetical protein